ncbi:hypothetical protein D1872_282370 [compost metagenome]
MQRPMYPQGFIFVQQGVLQVLTRRREVGARLRQKTLLFLKVGKISMLGDLAEPHAELAVALKAVNSLKRFKKRFLGDFLGQFLIPA